MGEGLGGLAQIPPERWEADEFTDNKDANHSMGERHRVCQTVKSFHEDDREAASYLIQALDEAGHITHHAADGETGYAMASGMDYDVLIVDRMLPRRDGLSIVESLRAEDDKTPVLILSALGEVDDRVTGLRAGGDAG